MTTVVTIKVGEVTLGTVRARLEDEEDDDEVVVLPTYPLVTSSVFPDKKIEAVISDRLASQEWPMTTILSMGEPDFDDPKHWRLPGTNEWIPRGFISVFRPSENHWICLIISRAQKRPHPRYVWIAHDARQSAYLALENSHGCRFSNRAFRHFLDRCSQRWGRSFDDEVLSVVGRRNYKSLFGLSTLPVENHIRELQEELPIKRRRYQQQDDE